MKNIITYYYLHFKKLKNYNLLFIFMLHTKKCFHIYVTTWRKKYILIICLQSHLLTPYLNPSTHAQHKYNEAHIRTRNTVERQYGVLKRRFPVLAVGIRLKLKTAVNVILACSILHNICIIRKEQDPINDGNVTNLEELIENGQIPSIPLAGADPSYGFQRNLMTQYFENLKRY